MTQRLLDALLETQQNVNITVPLVLLAKELRTLHTNVCPLCLTYHSCKEFNRLEDIILTSEASEKESEADKMTQRILDALREMQSRQRTTQYYLSAQSIAKQADLNEQDVSFSLLGMEKRGIVTGYTNMMGLRLWRLNPDYVESETET